MTNRRILVLGYGNPGREDDGLGPAAAAEIERWQWPGVTARDNYQLVIEDAVDVAAADVVWFIDSTQTGLAPYQVRRLQPANEIAFTSHIVKPEVVLELARRYYGRSPEAYLMGIRGYRFEFVEKLSKPAGENLRQAVEALQSEIARYEEGAA